MSLLNLQAALSSSAYQNEFEESIRLDVSVLAADGTPIDDLTSENFHLHWLTGDKVTTIRQFAPLKVRNETGYEPVPPFGVYSFWIAPVQPQVTPPVHEPLSRTWRPGNYVLAISCSVTTLGTASIRGPGRIEQIGYGQILFSFHL